MKILNTKLRIADLVKVIYHFNLYEDLTFAQFERERYNKELEKRNSIIKELQSENKYLHKELKRHVTLLSKKK